MKVTMTEAICPEGMALLEGKADIFVAHDAHPHNYLDQLKDTDAFIVRVADKGAIDKETMESSESLKVIGRTGIGYDSVDVESATKLGIPVVVTPGANNRSVAEHAITLMLALSKNMVESDVEQRKGNWKIRDAKKAFEVEEKTCLIIGLGTIGKIIARWAPSSDGNNTQGYIRFVSKTTGIPVDEPLRFDDQKKMVSIVRSMAQMESGIIENEDILNEAYCMV